MSRVPSKLGRGNAPKRSMSFTKKHNLASTKYSFIFILLYVILIFALPANVAVMDKYNLRESQYHILLFLVTLPYMLVWASALLSYDKLKSYCQMLKKTPEGGDFQLITKGIKYLAYGLPVVAIITFCVNSLGNSFPGFKSASIIIINYLALLVPLLTYSVIRKGTHGLLERSRLNFSFGDMRVVIIAMVVAGVGYCFFMFKKINLDNLWSSDNPYYLPAWLVLTTVIIPYLYAWLNGLLAAYELVVFSRQVPGILYRHAVRWLASGVVCVVIGGVGLQYIRTVIPRTGHLSINEAFLMTCFAYILLILGFIFIYIGAARLKRIEEA